MFKIGEVYECSNGSSVLIVAVDTDMYSNSIPCPILGLCTTKGALHPTAIYAYTKEGWYCGVDPKKQASYAPYSITSNEPTEEEAALVRDMSNLCRGDYSDSDKAEKLLKVIRQLRKK